MLLKPTTPHIISHKTVERMLIVSCLNFLSTLHRAMQAIIKKIMPRGVIFIYMYLDNIIDD
jgi:hypothetical protein